MLINLPENSVFGIFFKQHLNNNNNNNTPEKAPTLVSIASTKEVLTPK